MDVDFLDLTFRLLESNPLPFRDFRVFRVPNSCLYSVNSVFSVAKFPSFQACGCFYLAFRPSYFASFAFFCGQSSPSACITPAAAFGHFRR